VVTASFQRAGRGRQGRTWTAPAGRALLFSVVIREPPLLLPLAAGVAVAGVIGPDARLKWPNDVHVNGRKVAGILVEGRPQERWAVLGVGLNVALRESDFPDELQGLATTMGLSPDAIEPTLAALLVELERWLPAREDELLDAFRELDTLAGKMIRWAGGAGRADGIDDRGRLLVITEDGRQLALDSGEVHLAQNAL
jgi:BirA family biotin operon repressor/biotin-[acetyl-CoA-carboxylase] ligase